MYIYSAQKTPKCSDSPKRNVNIRALCCKPNWYGFMWAHLNMLYAPMYSILER